jgi:hypothetical protein
MQKYCIYSHFPLDFRTQRVRSQHYPKNLPIAKSSGWKSFRGKNPQPLLEPAGETVISTTIGGQTNSLFLRVL